MMFVSFTPLDAVGTEIGLMLLTKMVGSIWSGSFFGVAILSVLVFLSLAKIAMDGIIEHRYETALFEFVRLAIAILLFTTIGSATIFSMNIINFGYAYQAAQNGSTIVGGFLNGVANVLEKLTGTSTAGYIYNDSKPTSASIQANGIPLMAVLYAIPSDLAYQISSIMLNPQKNATIDVSDMILNPSDFLYQSFISMADASNNSGAIYKTFAKCYAPQAYNTLGSLGGNGMSCSKFNQLWAKYAQNLLNQIKQKGNVPKNALFMDKNNIDLLKKGRFQKQSVLQSEYLGSVLNYINKYAKGISQLENTLSVPEGTLPSNSIGNKFENNLQQGAGRIIETIVLAASELLSLNQLLNDLMMTVQEYAIAAMFILLPLVVVVGLLPIFGNNYKLILKYMFSFFLIKLWIPVYWFIYVAMVNISALLISSAAPIQNGIHYIDNGIQYAITTFVGQSAYAQPIKSSTPSVSITGQQVISTANAMEVAAVANKFSAFNNIILAFFAVAIPGVLGSSATFLVGKGMMEAGVAAAAESAMFTKKLAGTAVSMTAKAVGKGVKAGGGAAWKVAKAGYGEVTSGFSGTKSAINTLKDTKMGYTVARDYFKDKQFNRALTKSLHTDSSVGTSAKALGVKMTKSTRENIAKAVRNGNILTQDKESGVSAFYDKNFNIIGIKNRDGSLVNANSLSAEDRARYSFDIENGFAVIDTKTGDFVKSIVNERTEIAPVYTKGRIGKIEDKKMLENLNKMLQ